MRKNHWVFAFSLGLPDKGCRAAGALLEESRVGTSIAVAMVPSTCELWPHVQVDASLQDSGPRTRERERVCYYLHLGACLYESRSDIHTGLLQGRGSAELLIHILLRRDFPGLTDVGCRERSKEASQGQVIFFFFNFRATPTAYGVSQARGLIGATAAGLHHSHSNAGSEPHL